MQDQPFPEQPVPGQDVAVTAIFPVLRVRPVRTCFDEGKADSPTQFDLPNRETMQPRPTHCSVMSRSVFCRYSLQKKGRDTLLAEKHYPLSA